MLKEEKYFCIIIGFYLHKLYIDYTFIHKHYLYYLAHICN